MIRLFIAVLKPLVYLLLLVVTGSIGYRIIEGWNFIDSVYMTVITITGVGFGEVHSLSPGGRIFTIFLVVGGVAFYGYAINVLVRLFLEKNFRKIMEENKTEDRLKKISDHFIICGGGRMAMAIAQEFHKNNLPFIIIENNPEAPVVKMHADWFILKRDALLEETLIEAGIHRSRGIASVLPTDADNLFVVLSARSLNPHIRIETRVSHESSRGKMIQAGANKIVSPYVIGGLQMARSFIEPNVDEFLDIMLDKGNYEFEMLVEMIKPDMPNAEKKIRDTDYRKKGYIIVGIKEPHGGFHFAPDPDFKLETGYEVMLLGKAQDKPITHHGKI